SSRRRHTRSDRDWSSDVCSSDLDVCAPMVMYRNYAWHRPFEIIGNQHPSWNVIGRGRGNVDSFEQESVTPFPAYDFGGKRFWLRSEERRVGKECRGRLGQ